MAKGATFSDDLLALIFNAAAIANVADNAASSPLTNLYLAAHTADPSGGSQSTNEISYTGYARKAVARTSGEWTVSAGAAALVNPQSFPANSGASAGTITHISVGTASSGTGKLLYSGAISPTISVAAGVTPTVNAGSQVTES